MSSLTDSQISSFDNDSGVSSAIPCAQVEQPGEQSQEQQDTTSHAQQNAGLAPEGNVATGRRLASEAVWVVGGRILGIATAIGINVLLARILPPDEVGVFFLLATILTFAAIVAMFGLNAALVRFVSEQLGVGSLEEADRTLKLGAGVATVAILSGGVACAAFLMLLGGPLFGLSNTMTLGPIVGLGVVASAILQLCGSLLRSFHDSRLSIMLTGQFGGPMCNLLFIFSAVLLHALFQPSIVVVMILSSTSMLIIVPLALVAVYRISRRRLDQLSREKSLAVAQQMDTQESVVHSLPLSMLLAVSFPLVLTQALSYVTGQADVWIAGATIEHADLALYGAARRLMLLIGMPMQLVNLTVVASIAELRAQGRLPELEKILRSAATMAAIPAVLVWLPLAIFPEQILGLLFGEFYSQSATILRILCIGQIVFVAVGAAELTLMMSGNQRSALMVNCFTAVLLLFSGYFLTLRFGPVGLAIAWSLVVSLQCVLFSLMARKMIRVWTVCDFRLLLKFPELLATAKTKLGKTG